MQFITISFSGEGTAPLARDQSLSSGGFHTPIEDDDDEDDDDEVQESMFVEGEGLSEIPTDLPGISVSRGGSFIGTTQAPSPSSAVMTVSLDAYLDTQRISYGSPDLMPRISSPDDTFPVFSPPPFDVNFFFSSFAYPSNLPLPNPYQERDEQVIDQNMLVPPGANGGGSSAGSSGSSVVGTVQPSRRHRRLSSLNTVSWPNQNELTVSPRPRRMSTVAGSDGGLQENNVNCDTHVLFWMINLSMFLGG